MPKSHHPTRLLSCDLSRREALQRMLAIAGAASAGGLILPGAYSRVVVSAQNGTVRVADPGGPYTDAWAIAYHEPFREETGIDSEQIARQHEPVAEVTTQVGANNVTWDAVVLTEMARLLLTREGLLESLELDNYDYNQDELMESSVTEDWIGIDVVGTVFAYRTDVYDGDEVPESWADFWDVEKFPGRRGMYRSPYDTLEEAVLASGVSREDLYPLDVDLAFEQLDKIKDHVGVWFEGGAQATQLLMDGEVDMIATWNGRAQAAIDAGAPAQIVWKDWIAQQDGIAIPMGAPNAENARRFIEFMTDAERMAAWTEHLAYGPTNERAYEFIPEERAQVLPGSPSNRDEMIETDVEWRAENSEAILDRFNAWILE